MSRLMFFAVDVEEQEPEVHSLDIFVGEEEPEVPEEVELRVFKGKKGLQSFLMAGEWDRATIYKSSECPQGVVDELADWMNLHMSLEKVVTLKEDKNKGEKDE
jgi:hypothetical protein